MLPTYLPALSPPKRRGELDVDILHPLLRRLLCDDAESAASGGSGGGGGGGGAARNAAENEARPRRGDLLALAMQITAVLQFSPSEKDHVMRVITAQAESAQAESHTRSGGFGPGSLMRVM